MSEYPEGPQNQRGPYLCRVRPARICGSTQSRLLPSQRSQCRAWHSRVRRAFGPAPWRGAESVQVQHPSRNAREHGAPSREERPGALSSRPGPGHTIPLPGSATRTHARTRRQSPSNLGLSAPHGHAPKLHVPQNRRELSEPGGAEAPCPEIRLRAPTQLGLQTPAPGSHSGCAHPALAGSRTEHMGAGWRETGQPLPPRKCL